MAGKKKSIAKESKSRGEVESGKNKNVSKSNIPQEEENVEKTKIHPRKRRKGPDGEMAETFLSSLDKGSKSDIPRGQGALEKTKAQPRKQRKVADGEIAEAFLSLPDKGFKSKLPRGKRNVEKTKNELRKRRKGADGKMVEAFLSSPDRGSSMLRPRKQVPTFQKVELNERDFKEIVGKRIKVFWPDSRRWFQGCIKSFDDNKKHHSVFYDDGEKEELDLKAERFELEVVPEDGFTICRELGVNHKIEKGSDGVDISKETMEEDSIKVGVSSTEPDKGSLLLRPRKQMPTFRKVDLSEGDFKYIVGKRIKVFWPESRRWFQGYIKSFDNTKKRHSVFYDDGDKEELDLKAERFELEVVPEDGFTICRELGANLKKIEKASDGVDIGNETKEEDSIKVGVSSTEPDKGSLLLRPRKQIPTFRKVELSERDFKDIVGKRIKVFWSESRRWFRGYIKSFDNMKKRHSVFYDDGDKEELDLKAERFELEVVPEDGFTICSELGVNLKKKEIGSNGGDIGKETKEEGSIKVGVSSTEPSEGSLLLRPRKQIPAFRKVELSENDCQKIVGKRIKVFWPDSRRWFQGFIKSFDNKKKRHSILYDDGDKEDLDLKDERFELEIVPEDGFTISTELGANLKKKEIGSNGGDSRKESKEDDLVKVKSHAKVEKEVVSKAAKKTGMNDGPHAKEKSNLTTNAEVASCGSGSGTDNGETESNLKSTVETNGSNLTSKAAKRSSKLHTGKGSIPDKDENLIPDVKIDVLPKNVFKNSKNSKNGNIIVKPGDFKSGTGHNETDELLRNKSRRKTNRASDVIQVTKPKRHTKDKNGETLIKEKHETKNSEVAGDKVKELQSGEENIMSRVLETNTRVAELEISEVETLDNFLKNYVKKRRAMVKSRK